MRILFVLFAAMSASSIPSNRLSDETRDDWDICVCSKSLSFLGYFWEYFIYTNFLNKKILFFLHKKVCFFYTKIFFFYTKIFSFFYTNLLYHNFLLFLHLFQGQLQFVKSFFRQKFTLSKFLSSKILSSKVFFVKIFRQKWCLSSKKLSFVKKGLFCETRCLSSKIQTFYF